MKNCNSKLKIIVLFGLLVYWVTGLLTPPIVRAVEDCGAGLPCPTGYDCIALRCVPSRKGPGIVNLAIPQNFLNYEGLAPFIARLWKIAFIFAALATLLYLVMAGWQWLTSGGDPKSVEAARNKITQALVGLALIALSYAIIIFIGSFFQIDILKPEFPVPE